MPPPALLILGPRQFRAAAQLRTAGEAARIVRWFAVAQRGEHVAAADLVAEEMRRGRHHDRIVRFGRHPVDAGKMEAADTAGLMAARAGDVVEPALEPSARTVVL